MGTVKSRCARARVRLAVLLGHLRGGGASDGDGRRRGSGSSVALLAELDAGPAGPSRRRARRARGGRGGSRPRPRCWPRWPPPGPSWPRCRHRRCRRCRRALERRTPLRGRGGLGAGRPTRPVGTAAGRFDASAPPPHRDPTRPPVRAVRPPAAAVLVVAVAARPRFDRSPIRPSADPTEPRSDPARRTRVELAAAGRSALGDTDLGPLADPARRAACLRAVGVLGLDPWRVPLGGRRVELARGPGRAAGVRDRRARGVRRGGRRPGLRPGRRHPARHGPHRR